MYLGANTIPIDYTILAIITNQHPTRTINVSKQIQIKQLIFLVPKNMVFILCNVEL